ncbi:MAG: hypothetical protein GY906_01095 [bacterium]|nr:hypothetical protein [bacterium]
MSNLVRVDSANNRIRIYFKGFFSLEDAEALRQAYSDAIAKMSDGFTVITFAEGYMPGTPEVQEIIASMTQLAELGGCAKVARVVGGNPLGGYQIDRLAKTDTSYPSQHFKTEEEAIEYLDSDEE